MNHGQEVEHEKDEQKKQVTIIVNARPHTGEEQDLFSQGGGAVGASWR